jgi:hypothetical protein
VTECALLVDIVAVVIGSWRYLSVHAVTHQAVLPPLQFVGDLRAQVDNVGDRLSPTLGCVAKAAFPGQMVLGPVVAVATHELGHRLVRSVASLASGILVSALQREGMHLGWQARIGKARRRVTVFAVGTIVIGIWRLVTVCALCARCQLEVEVWVAVDANDVAVEHLGWLEFDLERSEIVLACARLDECLDLQVAICAAAHLDGGCLRFWKWLRLGRLGLG